jgi:stage II sporulation protein R
MMLVIYKTRRRITLGILGVAVTAIATVAVLGKYGSLIAHNNDNLLRLHVVANSNTPADQQLKLQVRDALLPLLQQIVSEKNTADEVAAAVAAKQAQLTNEAAAVVSNAGFTYPVRVELGVYPFDAKNDNRGVRVPAGYYSALKVILGEGEGNNWWCILFPPLCFGPNDVEVAAGKTNVQWRWRFWPSKSRVVYAGAK